MRALKAVLFPTGTFFPVCKDAQGFATLALTVLRKPPDRLPGFSGMGEGEAEPADRRPLVPGATGRDLADGHEDSACTWDAPAHLLFKMGCFPLIS